MDVLRKSSQSMQDADRISKSTRFEKQELRVQRSLSLKSEIVFLCPKADKCMLLGLLGDMGITFHNLLRTKILPSKRVP